MEADDVASTSSKRWRAVKTDIYVRGTQVEIYLQKLSGRTEIPPNHSCRITGQLRLWVCRQEMLMEGISDDF